MPLAPGDAATMVVSQGDGAYRGQVVSWSISRSSATRCGVRTPSLNAGERRPVTGVLSPGCLVAGDVSLGYLVARNMSLGCLVTSDVSWDAWWLGTCPWGTCCSRTCPSGDQ